MRFSMAMNKLLMNTIRCRSFHSLSMYTISMRVYERRKYHFRIDMFHGYTNAQKVNKLRMNHVLASRYLTWHLSYAGNITLYFEMWCTIHTLVAEPFCLALEQSAGCATTPMNGGIGISVSENAWSSDKKWINMWQDIHIGMWMRAFLPFCNLREPFFFVVLWLSSLIPRNFSSNVISPSSSKLKSHLKRLSRLIFTSKHIKEYGPFRQPSY